MQKGPTAAPACGEVAAFMSDGPMVTRREKINAMNDLNILDGQKQVQCTTVYEGRVVHAQWMNRSVEKVDATNNNSLRGCQREQQIEEPPKQR